MSIIDNVLIAVDDQDQTKDSIAEYFPTENTAVLFSGLGRLVGKKLIKQNGKGKNTSFSITDLGATIVEDDLEYLHNLVDKEAGQWVIVSASIPEKHKVEREKVRLTLKDWGFGLIKNGLFIGHVANIDQFKEKLESVKVNSSIYIFPINSVPEDIITNANDIWNLKKITSQYKTWIKDANKFIKSLPKDKEVRRVQAKSIVYDLALIIKGDPKIENKKIADQTGRTDALKIYKLIRNYCY